MSLIIPDILALAFPIGLGIISSKLPHTDDYIEPPQEHETPIYSELTPSDNLDSTSETNSTESQLITDQPTENNSLEDEPLEDESLEDEPIETTEDITIEKTPYPYENPLEDTIRLDTEITQPTFLNQKGGYLLEPSFMVEMGLSVVPWALFALTPAAGENTSNDTLNNLSDNASEESV